MKKHDNGLCSLEEYNRLRSRIIDAVEEWLSYCDADPEIGIAIEQSTLETELCSREDAHDREWYPLEPFATAGDCDDEAVREFADSICFVR